MLLLLLLLLTDDVQSFETFDDTTIINATVYRECCLHLVSC